MYILINTYHNTVATTKYSPEERKEISYRVYSGVATNAEKQARNRARRSLCGIRECMCSNGWGERIDIKDFTFISKEI